MALNKPLDKHLTWVNMTLISGFNIIFTCKSIILPNGLIINYQYYNDLHKQHFKRVILYCDIQFDTKVNKMFVSPFPVWVLIYFFFQLY